MSNEMMSEIKRDHIMNLLAEGKRQDGRGVTDVRKIQVETNCIESADGSARVKLGRTEVIAGVKIIPGTPFGDTPNIGVLTTGAELIPMAHPTFESGPPGEDAIELARVVDRGIRESGRGAVRQGREHTPAHHVHPHIGNRGQSRKHFNSRPRLRRRADFIRTSDCHN